MLRPIIGAGWYRIGRQKRNGGRTTWYDVVQFPSRKAAKRFARRVLGRRGRVSPVKESK
jgi:hypothetical protein